MGGLKLLRLQTDTHIVDRVPAVNTLRKYVLYLWLVFATLVVLIVSTVSRLGTQRFLHSATHGVARWWAWGMLRITGTRCHVEGLENIPGTGPYVVMGNHRSHLDAAVLIYNLPFLFGFIVKQELMKIPIFAGGMRSIGCVAVSRKKSKDDHAVLDGAAQEVAGGKNILVFPEGTRAPTDDFLPFKKGGVLLAIKAGVPILPFGLSGTGKVIPARILTVTPGEVQLNIGTLISTDGLTIDDRDTVLESVRQRIVDLYIPGYPDGAEIQRGDP